MIGQAHELAEHWAALPRSAWLEAIRTCGARRVASPMARRLARVLGRERGLPVRIEDEEYELDEEIDWLYRELRSMADDPNRSANAHLEQEYVTRLRELQVRQADAMERQFLRRRELDPAALVAALERADALIKRHGTAASDDTPSR